MVFNNEKMADILINYAHVSTEAFKLALKLCGDREQVYKDILFIYTGVSDFDFFIEEVSKHD